MNKPQFIIIHHTASSYAGNPDQFQATNNYHKGKWGEAVKSSLGYYGGYHYEIAADGKIGQFRKDNEVGAHTSQDNMNYQSIGICLDGDFDKEDPTPQQIVALIGLIKQKKTQYNIDNQHIFPHRRFATYKSCWGSRLPDNIMEYLEKHGGMLQASQWALTAIEKAKKKGTMLNWNNPQAPMDDATWQWIFLKLGAIDKVTNEPITRERAAVILDRLKLLD